ncbi:MAG: flagellar motor switch protein FliN, partial [Vallitaleaceae bacterium]|nr:flagellar motor switch protein FliN [Vallitaleaceae bacterium]
MGMQGMNNMGMQGMNNMGMQGMNNMGMQGMNNMGMQGMHNMGTPMRNVEVQQAQFQNFDYSSVVQQKENIDLIMDVQLDVTVELGRTRKSIKDVLEFAPGTIIELNKLSGEPIDVLVNGKVVAKGEVVVIDENFSIRVTEIIKQQGQL